jgi:transposase-like protein
MKDFALKVLDQRTEKGYTVSYPQLSGFENLLMLNLAMCEHLRWNAAHEILGYVNNTTEHECNDLKRRHNCLKPWQQLDNESKAVSYINNYKLFDFGVVETTFKLEYKPN